MEELKNLEELILTELVESSEEVRIVFVTGYQTMAEILDFNCDVLLVKNKKTGHKWMVYRHAVSTIDMG